MKAFTVTICVPNDWQKQDVLIACNIGIKKHATTNSMPHINESGFSWSTHVADEFSLSRQDI